MNKSKTKPLSREFRAVGRDLSARLLAAFPWHLNVDGTGRTSISRTGSVE